MTTYAIAEFSPQYVFERSTLTRALDHMSQLLNVPITRPADLFTLAQQGISTNAFVAFSKAGYTRSELEWIIPARTFSHRQQKDGVLTLEESDKLLRAAKIQALSIEVLGDATKALAWMHKTRGVFNGQSAMELIKTEHGAHLIEEALIQLDEGYF
ncbi:MAG: antitoxin Xre/MbcA/ParS toxin-binding domain-containing protein [Marinagarivorans sp.]|nr:antitoxin Xre/MbcA/ParS toxin-binding domain-containing protein [Marinagarivorans sp.]